MSVTWHRPSDCVHDQIGDDDDPSACARLCLAMPSSIAARTSSQPPDCAAALPVATRDQARRRAARGATDSGRDGRGRCGAYPTLTSSPNRPAKASPSTGADRLGGRPRRRGRPPAPPPGRRARAWRAAVRRRARCGPRAAGRRRATRSCSVCVSTAESGSSRTITRASANERAGERDPLPLAAGEVDAPLADQRVVAVGQVGDEVGHPCGDAHRLDLVPGRVGPAGRQVLSRSVDREQIGRWVITATVVCGRTQAATSRRSTPPT